MHLEASLSPILGGQQQEGALGGLPIEGPLAVGRF